MKKIFRLLVILSFIFVLTYGTGKVVNCAKRDNVDSTLSSSYVTISCTSSSSSSSSDAVSSSSNTSSSETSTSGYINIPSLSISSSSSSSNLISNLYPPIGPVTPSTSNGSYAGGY